MSLQVKMQCVCTVIWTALSNSETPIQKITLLATYTKLLINLCCCKRSTEKDARKAYKMLPDFCSCVISNRISVVCTIFFFPSYYWNCACMKGHISRWCECAPHRCTAGDISETIWQVNFRHPSMSTLPLYTSFLPIGKFWFWFIQSHWLIKFNVPKQHRGCEGCHREVLHFNFYQAQWFLHSTPMRTWVPILNDSNM